MCTRRSPPAQIRVHESLVQALCRHLAQRVHRRVVTAIGTNNSVPDVLGTSRSAPEARTHALPIRGSGCVVGISGKPERSPSCRVAPVRAASRHSAQRVHQRDLRSQVVSNFRGRGPPPRRSMPEWRSKHPQVPVQIWVCPFFSNDIVSIFRKVAASCP